MFFCRRNQSAKKKEISIDIGVTFVKGIVYGLGMIVAFAVVVPFFVWFLRAFDWIPFISDIAIEVAEKMQNANSF